MFPLSSARRKNATDWSVMLAACAAAVPMPQARFKAFTNSTSSVMVTSSPTRMPPVSSAAFQVRPKSLRLILVVAESAEARVAPGIFGRRRRAFDRELNFAGDAVNRQVAALRQVRHRPRE